jgi:hypothetical protein
MEDPERIVVPIFMGFGLSMTLQMFLFEWLFRDAQSASYRILGRAGRPQMGPCALWFAIFPAHVEVAPRSWDRLGFVACNSHFDVCQCGMDIFCTYPV